MTARDMPHCIEECQRCHRVCLETLTQHCLKVGGKHVEQDHVRLMLDCIQICQTSADFMIRRSPLHVLTCLACSEVCNACAISCEQVGGMEECVRICRECALACAAMSKQTSAV